MARPGRLPFPLFAGVSLGIHVAALVAVAERPPLRPPPTFDPTSAPLAGDTLEVEPPAEPAPSPDEGDPAPKGSPAPAPRAPGPGPHLASPGATASGGPSAPPVFGAVGVRYATDLATTFTRGFPQAASADSVWNAAALGSAGTGEVTLVIDDSGHLVSSSVQGSPSEALRRGIERTLVLMRPRTFTARGAVTRLRVTARVSRDDVHDGLHGDVFALSGGSFAGQVGTAFFALPAKGGPGRRIDVELRLLP